MLAAAVTALADLFAPYGRRALLLSLVYTVALLVALWLGATVLLQLVDVTGFRWIDEVVGVLGSLATIFLAWVLFPALSATVLSFFLYGIAESVERRHYPGLPPPRPQPVGEIIFVSLRLGLLAIVVNLIMLPFYFWPALNLVVYYGLNGYLVGRQFFLLIALRRLDILTANAMWRHYRLRLVTSGAAIAFMLTVPIVNLAAPVWAAALMLHLFERLRAPQMGPAESGS
ncbi:MAG: EI24 domain-containing protein [Stellaceae bacterium]